LITQIYLDRVFPKSPGSERESIKPATCKATPFPENEKKRGAKRALSSFSDRIQFRRKEMKEKEEMSEKREGERDNQEQRYFPGNRKK
jgi:Fe-S-cluster containining protein